MRISTTAKQYVYYNFNCRNLIERLFNWWYNFLEMVTTVAIETYCSRPSVTSEVIQQLCLWSNDTIPTTL